MSFGLCIHTLTLFISLYHYCQFVRQIIDLSPETPWLDLYVKYMEALIHYYNSFFFFLPLFKSIFSVGAEFDEFV